MGIMVRVPAFRVPEDGDTAGKAKAPDPAAKEKIKDLLQSRGNERSTTARVSVPEVSAKLRSRMGYLLKEHKSFQAVKDKNCKRARLTIASTLLVKCMIDWTGDKELLAAFNAFAQEAKKGHEKAFRTTPAWFNAGISYKYDVPMANASREYATEVMLYMLRSVRNDISGLTKEEEEQLVSSFDERIAGVPFPSFYDFLYLFPLEYMVKKDQGGGQAPTPAIPMDGAKRP